MPGLPPKLSSLELLHFAAQSPIQFVVVDPMGRKAGYDPTSDTTWTEIPDAYYLYEGLFEENVGQETALMKTLNVPDPLDGPYLVVVYGIGDGDYRMEVTSMDWQGISKNSVFIGTITTGQIIKYEVNYSQVTHQIFVPVLNK